MQEQAVAGNSDKEINQAFIALMSPVILVLLAWAAVFHLGLVTAFDIWYNSDIFNHCLFPYKACLQLRLANIGHFSASQH